MSLMESNALKIAVADAPAWTPARPDARLPARQDQTDEALMASIATGDRAAFDVLVKRHLSRVVGVASRMLSSRGDGEEVAQEAFVRVWTYAPRWQPVDNGRGAPFRTWLYRIVLNLVIDRKRQRPLVPIDDTYDPVDESDDGFAQLYRQQLSQAVAAAVARLPDRQRAVLVLCFFEGRSNIEAGKILSLTVSAVESLLVRARRSLREDLGTSYSELAS
jgi:RNA polymerase sigma-70 factor (ECF subfamily)